MLRGAIGAQLAVLLTNILTCGAKLSVGITTHYEGNEILLGAQTLIGLHGLYFSEHVGCTHY